MNGYKALPAETCGDCKYFRRHYIRIDEDDYLSIDYGHCVYPRLKKRRTEEHCIYWTSAKAENR